MNHACQTTALMTAAQLGHVSDLSKRLLAAGAGVDEIYDR